MRTRTMMTIWLVALLLLGGALLGACGSATSSPVPATAVAATIAPLPTTVPTPATAAAIDTAAPSPATAAPSALDAAALLEARCVDCHSLSRTTGARYTQEKWQQVVTRMIRQGAVLNPDEEAALVTHLAETYKP